MVKGLAVLFCCNPEGVLVVPKFVDVLPNRGFVPKVVLLLPLPLRPVPRPKPELPNGVPLEKMQEVLEPLNMEGVVVWASGIVGGAAPRVTALARCCCSWKANKPLPPPPSTGRTTDEAGVLVFSFVRGRKNSCSLGAALVLSKWLSSTSWLCLA